MAKETRRQRRDARRAAGDGAAAPASPPARAQTVPAESAVTHERGGFIRECWGELKKVDWPNRAQVIQGTIVVLIACAIVGAFLWGVDQVLRPFVRDVLLG
ncbi:MAG TPA: preprotein translocase subunit SecE [Gaiellaceae bacterium]